MFRMRLAALMLSGTLMMVSGCMQTNGCCGGGLGLGLFGNHWGTPSCDCHCGSMTMGMSSSYVVSPDTYTSPPPPVLPSAQQPRVIPVPQAPALPYNPNP